jgi:hypothetical protein
MASVTPAEIRQYIKDSPDLNFKGEEEFTVADIERAIDFVVDDFNTTPPLDIVYYKEDFPFRSLLLLGVTAHLYFGESFHQERNNLPVSSGGVTVDDSSHSAPYMQLAGNLFARYEDQKRRLKISINISRGWGTIRSDFPYHV